MSTIDERIVQMRFNNDQFQQGIKTTTDSLFRLKDSLKLDSIKNGLGEITESVKNFSIHPLTNSVDALKSKFTLMSGAAVIALGNIAAKAIATGTQLLNSLTIAPIKAGFDEYELKMKSIQTILANTAQQGTTLKDVTKALDDLNEYSDKTIYNFGQMTKNVGLFTNAGIKLEDATSMIKGFSNAAAAAGTDAEGAARGAYQLSQAISAGTVRLMDWRSLQNVGMGGQNMKQGLVDLAEAMGTFDRKIKGKGQSSPTLAMDNFNESLQSGWLTADVMSKYLKIMAGDMDAASIAALGLSKAQVDSFLQQQKTAEEAATKVRTWTQLQNTLQEAVASTWSKTFELVIGDFDSATKLWTAVNDALSPMIGAAGEARNKLLEGWAKIGGRDKAIAGLTNVFEALMSIIKPIGEAFKAIFPPTTVTQLYNMTKGFEAFTKKLILNEQNSKNLKNTFKGLFAAVDIVMMVIKGIVGVFGKLLSPLGAASGGVLSLTGGLGNFIVNVRDAIKNGGSLTKLFEFIGNVLKAPIDLIKQLSEAMSANNGIATSWKDIWDNIARVFKAFWDWMKPAIDWFIGALVATKDAIAGAFKSMDFNSVLLILNTGLIGGAILMVKRFISFLKKGFKPIGSGLADKIKGIFTQLTDTMKSMQQQIKAETLIKIAIAIGILSVSILILSTIDVGKLISSLTAISVMFAQLVLTMKALEKIGSAKSAAKMMLISVGLILLSTAMVIFASAVRIMAKLSWDEIARGLTVMSASLIILSKAAEAISKKSGTLVKASFGIFVISGALLVLGKAMQLFATLSWEDIGKGIAVLSSTLAVLSVFSKTMGNVTGLVAAAGSLFIISTALLTLTGVMKVLSMLSWESVGKGLVTLAGAMLIMGLASRAMSGQILGSGALLLSALALTIFANAIKTLATLSWEQVAIGLTMLGASMIILSGALMLMNSSIVGAGALLIAAAAIGILAPALKLMGSLKWDQVAVGLVVLAGALAIIAGAGYLLIAGLPGLLGLGATAILIGLGMQAAGIGVLAFAKGLLILSGITALAGAAITALAIGFINLIPLILQKVAEGLVKIAKVISGSTVQFIGAFTAILTALVTSIANVTPLFITTIFNLLTLLLIKLNEFIPLLITTGFNLIIAFLDGIAKALPKIIKSGTDIIIAWIKGIAESSVRIVNAAFDALLTFIEGITKAINKYAPKLRKAGEDLAKAIADGLLGGLASAAGGVVDGVVGWGADMIDGFKKQFGINSPSKVFAGFGKNMVEGLSLGLDGYSSKAYSSANNVGQSAVDGLSKSISGISDIALSNMDMNPTIRPVLDLSAIKAGSTSIDSMLTPSTLSVGSTYNKASTIAADQLVAKSQDTTQQQDVTNQGATNISFIQNNTSPKALTAAEIYRQTKNQISAARGNLVVS